MQQYAEFIFGPDSVYLPKALIKTEDGTGTIPDGFVVDVSARAWFIVEAELAEHNVWSHIAPQVAKQIIAATNPIARRLLTDKVIAQVKQSRALQERFSDLGISSYDISSFLQNIFDRPPVVALPIDEISSDLNAWAQTLKTEVKLWLIRKLVDLDDPGSIIYEIPDNYRPTADTSPNPETTAQTNRFYDVSLADLIRDGLLREGDALTMNYGRRGEEKRLFEAQLQADGSLTTMGQNFRAPSYAAMLVLRAAGSDRTTINGWTAWRAISGRTLSELRQNI